MTTQETNATEKKKENKPTIMLVRSHKNADDFDSIKALAKKFGCTVSGLMSDAIKRYMENPPDKAPEIARSSRGSASGFWVQVETDENNKPSQINVVEVGSRSDAVGKTFFRYSVKDGVVNDESRQEALAEATEQAKEFGTWCGLTVPKKNIKVLKR